MISNRRPQILALRLQWTPVEGEIMTRVKNNGASKRRYFFENNEKSSDPNLCATSSSFLNERCSVYITTLELGQEWYFV